ncbi:MAG: aminoacyl-tRNA hydrolase [Proteobacteria bacterium]|nr:aminoacyl-tRNA hydrolase [Pseudomonadota bacterium]
MLHIDEHIAIAEDELVERFLRADGPGGQHVNRTESAVELRFDIARSPSLPEPVRARLLARSDRRVTADGVLVIQSRRFRDQARNRADARERLAALVRAATQAPKPRLATKPTRASKLRRLEGKKQRGQIKRDRRAVDADP